MASRESLCHLLQDHISQNIVWAFVYWETALLSIVFYAIYHTPAYEYEHVCAQLATTWLLESLSSANPSIQVRLDGRHFIQMQGIPQGSILSTLLCRFAFPSSPHWVMISLLLWCDSTFKYPMKFIHSYFFGAIEAEHFPHLQQQGLLMRLVSPGVSYLKISSIPGFACHCSCYLSALGWRLFADHHWSSRSYGVSHENASGSCIFSFALCNWRVHVAPQCARTQGIPQAGFRVNAAKTRTNFDSSCCTPPISDERLRVGPSAVPRYAIY